MLAQAGGKPRRVLDVVRAGYGLSVSDPEWLRSLLETSSALLDRGEGLMAYTYDASTRAVRFGEFATTGRASASFERLAECVARQDAEVQYRIYRTGGAFGSTSQLLGLGARLEQAPFFVERFHPIGVRDFLTLNATDPTGMGLALCAPVRAISEPSASTRAAWARAAAHLAAAFRLRRGLGTTSPMVSAEAILTPAGRIEHVEEGASSRRARSSLRRATKILEATTQRKASAPDAMHAWTALVEGKWSMIDCFDSDGKRFIVARRNDPRIPSQLALSEQEGQIIAYARLGHGMKLIAYELGLPLSTVAVLLERGMKKLGLRSRQELVSMLGERDG